MKNTSNNPQRGQAIVLGASIGGLMVARALSNHFDSVTIIEKDKVERQPSTRKGQAHTRHLHGLLPGGLNAMLHYFPDLQDALAAHGANVCDFAKDMVWYTYGGYRQRFDMNLIGATMSRPLLEHLVRERVLATPNIELMDNTAVKSLIASDDQQRVKGVHIELAELGKSMDLHADLVVDVTGRGSRSAQWLRDLGFEAPETSEVKVNVSYATRVYKRDLNDPRSSNWMLYTPQAPQEMHFAGMFPIEGDRWIMTVGGWHGANAGNDEAAFMDFLRKLPMQEYYDIVSKSEPLSDIMTYKFPHSLRRHYEKLQRFPLGYLVLGDAVCSFNPTYGQGMTSASMQAIELDKMLGANIADEKLALTFFARIAKIIDIPWQMAVGEDFRYPATEGPKPAGVDFINKYISRVHRATLKDPVVCDAFLRVMSLLKAPTSLFHPKILWRVMWAG
ncbi:FAD-dependent oxidoreductase [Haliscomenobacter sp.]|uniref:FAD-dependent oxidoreductase n=1 Tax=Haliscomenobacter sp. TaxID=2717303 RepID=UPI003BAAE392